MSKVASIKNCLNDTLKRFFTYKTHHTPKPFLKNATIVLFTKNQQNNSNNLKKIETKH
jgi:hypothetical protein